MRKLRILAVLLMLCTSVITLKAKSGIGIIVNGRNIELDVSPIIVNDRTMVPFRAILESLGVRDIFWDENTKEIYVKKGDLEIILKIGDEQARINGLKYKIDAAPLISGDRTLVPVRFLAEQLGYGVDWSGGNVIISSEKKSEVNTSIPSNRMGAIHISSKKAVYLGMSKEDLIKTMGEPERLDDGVDSKVFIYNAKAEAIKSYIRIGISENEVTEISTNAPDWSFSGNFKAGDSMSGKDMSLYNKGREEWTGYYENGIRCVYVDQFTNTVSGIELRKSNTSLQSLKSSPSLEMSWALEMADMLNVERAKAGVKLLAHSDVAAKIADEHAKDMTYRQFVSHTNPDGKELKDRAAALLAKGVGENLSSNQNDPLAAINGFTNSKSHRDNMRNGNWAEMGIGISIADGNAEVKTAFVQVFVGK